MHNTWICDTRDFGIGRRLNYDNWNALRSAGEHASRRLCDAEAASAVPASDVATLNQVTRPSVTGDGRVTWPYWPARSRRCSPPRLLLPAR